MPRRRPLVLLAALVATIALAVEARAGQSDQRFAEGMKSVESGKFEEARQSFLQAYALRPTMPILWNLAIAEYKVGRHVDAIRHMKAYLKGSPTDPKYVQLAPTVMEKLVANTCHIEVEAQEGADVLLNADPWPKRAPLDDTIDVAPGNYAMEARKDDRSVKANTSCKAGETVKVKLVWQEKAAPALAGAPPPASSAQPGQQKDPSYAPPDGAPSRRWSTTHIVVTGGLAAVGVAGGVIGIVGLSGAKSDETTSRDLVAQQPGQTCVGSTSADCARIADLRKSHDAKQTLGVVALVGGGVFLGGAVASVLFWPKADAARSGRVRPVVGLGYLGLDGSF